MNELLLQIIMLTIPQCLNMSKTHLENIIVKIEPNIDQRNLSPYELRQLCYKVRGKVCDELMDHYCKEEQRER